MGGHARCHYLQYVKVRGRWHPHCIPLGGSLSVRFPAYLPGGPVKQRILPCAARFSWLTAINSWGVEYARGAINTVQRGTTPCSEPLPTNVLILLWFSGLVSQSKFECKCVIQVAFQSSLSGHSWKNGQQSLREGGGGEALMRWIQVFFRDYRNNYRLQEVRFKRMITKRLPVGVLVSR